MAKEGNETSTIKTFEGDLLKFELPPVSEKTDDFVDDDEPEKEEKISGFDDGENLEKPTDEYRGLMDDKGNPFDPAIHKTPPEKTPTGRWKRIPKQKREAGETGEPNALYRKQAQNFANLYASLHVTAFGSDGAVDKQALAPLVDSLELYFMEEGLRELSPKAQVMLSGFNYSTIICSREPNAEKLKRWFTPLILRIKKLLKLDKKKNAQPQQAQETEREWQKGQPEIKNDLQGQF